MRFFLPYALLLLALATAGTGAVGDPANDIAEPGYTQVKGVDELWRFHAGGSEKGLTLGTDSLCILSNRNVFLAGRRGGVYNDKQWCQREEHWELKSLGAGRFALKRYMENNYMSCMENGGVLLRDHVETEEKFLLFINKSGEKLSFYSDRYKKFVIAQEDGTMRCDSKRNNGGRTIFWGWKTGPKSAWEPNDEGRLVKTFDNKASKRIKQFRFTKTLGVKVAKNPPAGVRVDEEIIPTTALSKMFVKDYESPTQTEWSKQPKSIWGDAYTKSEEYKVYPGDKVRVYQIVGTYGPFEIYSDTFMDAPAENQEATVVEKRMATT